MAKIYGADVAEPVSQSGWLGLMTNHAVQFAVVRCYRDHGGGEPDQSCPMTVANAIAAGITSVDVYHYPVIGAKTPEAQAQEALAFLSQNDVRFDRVWLDVEEDDSAWSASDAAANIDFIERFVDVVEAADQTVGIYCGTAAWKKITGDTIQFAGLPPWWSSHGGEFEPSGGWTSPAAVQFRYEQVSDGVSFDGNYSV
jgi:hypothetical protein